MWIILLAILKYAQSSQDIPLELLRWPEPPLQPVPPSRPRVRPAFPRRLVSLASKPKSPDKDPVFSTPGRITTSSTVMHDPTLQDFCAEIVDGILEAAHKKVQASRAQLKELKEMFGNTPVEILGRGSFGTVFSGKDPAICYKCYQTRNAMEKEAPAMRFLLRSDFGPWCPYILEAWEPKLFVLEAKFFGERYIGYMAMERMDFDLNAIRTFNIRHANCAFRDIGSALLWLSQRSIAHTDVKLDNVLCDVHHMGHGQRSIRMKLGDIAAITVIPNCRFYSLRGTLNCVSPQMLTNIVYSAAYYRASDTIQYLCNELSQDYAVSSCEYLRTEDMWQLGLMLLSMLNDRFRNLNRRKDGWWRELEQELFKEDEGQDLNCPIWTALEDAQCEMYAKEIISEMLEYHSDDRLTFEVLSRHLRRMSIV